MTEQRHAPAARAGPLGTPLSLRHSRVTVSSTGNRTGRADTGSPAAGPDLAVVARELAIHSRRRQGLPDHITDPVALAQGAQLVLAVRRRAGVPRSPPG